MKYLEKIMSVGSKKNFFATSSCITYFFFPDYAWALWFYWCQRFLKIICLSNILALSVPEEDFSTKVSCTWNLISTFLYSNTYEIPVSQLATLWFSVSLCPGFEIKTLWWVPLMGQEIVTLPSGHSKYLVGVCVVWVFILALCWYCCLLYP